MKLMALLFALGCIHSTSGKLFASPFLNALWYTGITSETQSDTLLSPASASYNFSDRDITGDAGFPSVRVMYLDHYAKNAPEYLIDRKLTTLVRYLTKPAQTELEKVRVLFTWVATHLEYDDGALKNKRYGTPSDMAIILGKPPRYRGNA